MRQITLKDLMQNKMIFICDRPGPVLEPEVRRVESEEVRGCTEELRRILAQTLQGGD